MKIHPIEILLLAALTSACSSAPRTVPAAAAPPLAVEAAPATLEQTLQAGRSGRKDLYESGLRNLSRSSDPQLRSRALAMLGLFLEKEKRYPEAAATLKDAAGANPLISDYLRLHLVTVQRESGHPAEALQTALAVIASKPRSSAAAIARLRLPALYALAGDKATAALALSQLSTAVVDEFTEEEFLGTAAILQKQGLGDLATQIRYRVLNDYPQGRFTEKTYGTLATLTENSPLAKLSFEESVALADKLARVNRYDQSLDQLTRIVSRFPDRTADASLRNVRQRALFNTRRYTEVAALTWTPDEPYYLSGQLFRARAAWRANQNAEFLSTLEKIITDYPRSTEATEAKLLLGKYYITDEVDYPRAAKYLDEGIRAGGAGKDGENLWTLGWILTLAGKDTEALDAYNRYIKEFPDADYTSNALFWSGKIHDRRGNQAGRDLAFRRLIDFYPYSYYSYRAKELQGLPLTAPAEVQSGYAFPVVPDDVAGTAEPILNVARELVAVGLHEDAARELKVVAAARPEDQILAFRLADLYAEAGQPVKAMGTLQRSFRNIIRHGGTNVPFRFWEILYPRNYWEMIRPAAEKQGVDPYRMVSIIRQESGFDPWVVSNAGAVGLMQIMPAEASRIAELGHVAGPVTREQLFDPARSVEVGAAEYKQKLAAMDNNPLLAIAAYNAGETAVRGWLARTPLTDLDLFIETIPFAETRLYVKNVTRNEHEYRRIYQNRP